MTQEIKTDQFGDKRYYLNDKLHRKDGPAIECANGSKYWYLNGKLHREDGPAIELANGTKYWYLDGEELTEEEFKEKAKKNYKNMQKSLITNRLREVFEAGYKAGELDERGAGMGLVLTKRKNRLKKSYKKWLKKFRKNSECHACGSKKLKIDITCLCTECLIEWIY